MVIWADPAKSDLRAIHDFIASDSKYYAGKVVQDIMDRTNILEEYPRSGRKAPEIDDENIREISRIHTGFSTRSNRRRYTSSGSFMADGILHLPMSTESKNPKTNLFSSVLAFPQHSALSPQHTALALSSLA